MRLPNLGVMAELGRIAVTFGHEAARILADVLARDIAAEPDLKPTTRMVERWLRRERLAMVRNAKMKKTTP